MNLAHLRSGAGGLAFDECSLLLDLAGGPPRVGGERRRGHSGTGIRPTTSTPGSVPGFGLTTTVSAWPGMMPTSA